MFFFPSYEETEGIVVLEALSSEIPVLLRDIPVYENWLENRKDVYKGKTNEDFSRLIKDILEKRIPVLTWNGRKRALERDVNCQAQKLNRYYEQLV